MYQILNQIFAAEDIKADPDVSLPSESNWTDVDFSILLGYVDKIVTIALNFAIVLGIIMILYSAFQYTSSFGDESKAETAKKTLMWAIIGTVVVFTARIIKNFVVQAIY